MTLTRKPRVTLSSTTVRPAGGGTFAMNLTSRQDVQGVGGGADAAFDVPVGADATVTRTATSGTDASRFDGAIDCGAAGTTTAASLDLTNITADITCTSTADRRPLVTVKQALAPADDPGRFDLSVGGTLVRAGAGDGERERRDDPWLRLGGDDPRRAGRSGDAGAVRDEHRLRRRRQGHGLHA